MSTTADDIRTVGRQLREQGKDQPAKLAEQAADRAERVGGYLKESDADRILGDIEDFGRRQPLAVAAAGLALGFAASRFLKASSTERYQTSQQSGYRSNGAAGTEPVERPYPAGTGEISTGSAEPTVPAVVPAAGNPSAPAARESW